MYGQLNGIINGISFTKDAVKILGLYMGNNTKLCIKLNWTGKIRRLQKLLQKWNCRDLTFFGKITIIKCLGLSKFTFLASNCPTLEGVKSEIEKILYKFLWNGTEKIKRIIMCSPYNEGGLNMANTAAYFNALKASWLLPILETKDANWNSIAKSYITKLEKKSVLNFAFKDGSKFPALDSLPTFYQEMISAYAQHKIKDEPKTAQEILQQPLWGNEHIHNLDRHGKKVILHFKNWVKSGIYFVKDIKIEHNKIDEFYLFTKIQNKQNIYIEIASICKALKKYLGIIKSNTPSQRKPEQKEVKSISTKVIYNALLTKHKQIPPSEPKWQEELKCTINFNEAYQNKIVNIKEKKLAEFNFKCLHGILPCKYNLHKWKIEVNDSCEVCGERQDIIHLLFSCKRIQPIWKLVGDELNIKIDALTLITGHRNKEINCIITLISYLFYKEWIIIARKDNRNRLDNKLTLFLKAELHKRYDVYAFIGWYEYVQAIEKIMSIFK